MRLSLWCFLLIGLVFSPITAQSSPVITLDNADRLIALESNKAPVPGALSWSADGRWLAAAASTGLTIIDTTDSDRIVLTLPDVTTEALFGADGTTFTAGGRLYTLSGKVLLENGVGWADEEHRIVFVNETPDTTTLYPVEYGEVGEEIISIPFPATRVVVPPLPTLWNGIFIRDIDSTNEENPFQGEVTVWRWNDPIALQDGLSARTENIHSTIFEWDGEPIVSISPDGAVVVINMFEIIEVIDAYWGHPISFCDACYGMPYFVHTGVINPLENTRLVIKSYTYSRMETTPVILDTEDGNVVSEWFLPTTPIFNGSARTSTWKFTESHRFGAISAEEGIEVWQLDTPIPQQIAQIEGETVRAISEDGKRVLTRDADGLTVWSLDNLSAPKAVQINPAQPNRDAAFDRNNASALLFYGTDGYEVWNEQPDNTWIASSSRMESGTYRFEGQGRFVIRTVDYYPPVTTAIYDSLTGETLVERPAAFAVWPDGETLAVWDNNVLRIINSADLSSRDVLTLPGVSGEFFAVNLPLDQAYILDKPNAELDVYTIHTSEYQFSIPVGEIGDYPFRLLFSADGKRVVLTPRASAPAIWDVSGSSAVLIQEVGEAFLYPISLNDDGTLLASGRSLTDEETQALPNPRVWDQMVEIWDVESATVIHSIQTPYHPHAVFVPDTDLLLIQARTEAEVWNLATQPAVRQAYFDLEIDNAFADISMISVDFNDSRTLALGAIKMSYAGRGEAIVVPIPLDLETQEAVPVTLLWVSGDNIDSGPDFSLNETYTLMNASNFMSEPQTVIYRFSDEMSVLLPGQVNAMSPDETLLVTANPLRVWNVTELFTEDDPQPVVEYVTSDIESMVFSADGTQLYTWGEEGVTIWYVGE